jgi:cytochrome b involved in lipid metabolism
MNKRNILIGIAVLALIGLAALGCMYYQYEARWAAASSIRPTHAVVPGATFSVSEVATHNSPTDCWIIIGGNVIEATNFIAAGLHNDEIQKGCGKDATIMFAKVSEHGGARAKTMFDQLTIGTSKL